MAIPTPTRVVLLGLMGSGKSTVGRALARRTGWPYVDNDAVLASVTGRTAPELAAHGIDLLHDAERDVLEEVLEHEPPVIIGAAAAVVGDPLVGPLLRHQAFTVYLHVPPEVIFERIGADPNRPWLQEDPLDVLKHMYAARDPLYREAAVYVADGTLPPGDLSAQIYAELPRPM